MKTSGGNALSGALLVAGTCIGAGMLGLPLSTGGAGVGVTLLTNLLCWLFMWATGRLFLEATLWMPDGTNVLSMSEHFLGRWGKWVAGGAFLYLYYCLMVAYLSEGVQLFISSVEGVIGYRFAPFEGETLFVLFFGYVLYAGTRAIDRFNGLLMGGLFLTFVSLVGVGSAEIEMHLLFDSSRTVSAMAIPVLFSAFGYHNIVPSICTYLGRRERELQWAILVGTLIPLVIYTTWQMIVMGLVPSETLQEAANNGISVSQLLFKAAKSPWINGLVVGFSLFAIITSLLGVGMSMIDFLADGLQIDKERRCGKKRALLVIAVLFPPLIVAYNNPNLFLRALEYAGGYGEAFLNGALPIALVWVGRYRLKLHSAHPLPGGKVSLIALGAFTLFVMLLTALYTG